MKIFAIADTHLSMDPSIDKPMDIFGPEWEGHAEKLHNNWTELISDEDYVIIAGDISWGLRLEEAKADLEWIRALPGKKIIFKGNHDLWWQSLKKINELFSDSEGNPPDDLIFVQNDAVPVKMNDRLAAIAGTRGWICPGTEGFSEHDRKVYNREVLRLRMSLEKAKEMGAEEIIGVLHFPPTNDKQQRSGFTEAFEEYSVKNVVYGHLHNKEVWPKGIKGVLNGVNYRLISLDYLGARPVMIIESEE